MTVRLASRCWWWGFALAGGSLAASQWWPGATAGVVAGGLAMLVAASWTCGYLRYERELERWACRELDRQSRPGREAIKARPQRSRPFSDN